MRKTLAVAATVAGTLFLASPAAAASFDCGHVRAADEVTVCRTPSLSALDSEMGGLWYAYSRVPMLMGGSGDRAGDARAFLDRRRACGASVACLTSAYRARIAALHQGLDASMQEFFQMMHGT
jgi:uncharacterized protein